MEKAALASSSAEQDLNSEPVLPEYTEATSLFSAPAQQTVDDPSAPPQYAIAASSTHPVTHNFVRRNLFSSKVFVQSAGVDRYCFAAGKNARVWIHPGASTDNPPLGYLTFPTSHNNVRLYFGAGEQGKAGPGGMDENGFAFSDIKARIGYPHPGSFAFKGTTSDRVREYEWVNRDPSHDVTPVRYDLSVSGLAGVEALATLTVSRKGKGKTFVQWSKAPENELEQAFLILSAIGVITRLSNKGSYRDSDRPSGQRWFSVWWMAALSAHALGVRRWTEGPPQPSTGTEIREGGATLENGTLADVLADIFAILTETTRLNERNGDNYALGFERGYIAGMTFSMIVWIIVSFFSSFYGKHEAAVKGVSIALYIVVFAKNLR